MLNISIVEDDEGSAKLLERYVKKYFDEIKENYRLTLYRDGLDFISDYKGNCNIVFMDIEMPHLNGMQTAKKLRAIDNNVSLIFITNIAKYALKGYEVDALDFMLKPVDYFNFSLKMEKAIRIQKKFEGGVFCLETEDGIVKLNLSDIYFIETDKHFVIYHTDKGNFSVRASMKETEARFSKCGLIRCNSSYLVNLEHVVKASGETVSVGGEKLTVSRSRKKTFMQALMIYYSNGGSL
ncbi:MAG: response regulator transcription factor [Clostridia bacterium]|nr:response regulator transcription factor [Clostridia bacterium]